MARQTRELLHESRIIMDPQIISWIVSLIAGGAGGNVVGALLKNRNLGPMLNTVLGVAGGGLGGKVLPMLIPALGGLVGSGDAVARGTENLRPLAGTADAERANRGGEKYGEPHSMIVRGARGASSGSVGTVQIT